MSAVGQLGIYWGSDHFSIVENLNGQISNIFHVPFNTPIHHDGEDPVPNELKLPTLLQKTLEFRSVKTKTVNISVPTTDLIFRSFVIPVMSKKDVASAIEFEVTKYIPIRLDELTYTYHTVAYNDQNQKGLQALFMAVRKTRIEEIANAVQQAGLTLQNIEPAPISLIHLLKRNSIIQKNKTTAILEIGDENCEIIVLTNETLQFMRKISISLNHSDIQTLITTLQNEIRVSFNFYNRQNPQGKIENLIIMTEQKMPGMIEHLGKELNMPVAVISTDMFIPLEEFHTNAHVAAYGSTLRRVKFSPKFFDLSQQAIAMQRSGKDPLEAIKQYATMAGIIIACLFISLLTVFISNATLEHNREKIQNLTAKLGSYETLTADDLATQKQKIMTELQGYTAMSTDSQVSAILYEIPKILPEGVWLTGFQVARGDQQAQKDQKTGPVKISLTGKIYSSDANEQFSILNNFLAELKNNKTLSAFYTNVKRESANSSIEDGYAITTFSITCN